MAPTRSLNGPSGAAVDRMLGRTLGDRYRVLSRLGEGGMGTVYLCEHAVLGRRYAVKVLRPELGGDPELAERFRNEAISASRIGGDNVVDVLDYGTEPDGAVYIVMEALEGRSLGAIVVEEGPLELSRALGLLEQICHALGAAHARGVVHRDVKPDNVFVVVRPDGTEQAKVIDFGISQVAPESGRERLTQAGAIIGTPEYMAPEQANGAPVDHRADVYALGVLAYEVLTGTLPIVALTPIATLVAHQLRTPEPPSRRRPGVPPDVDALVMSTLAKRPEDRPASMEELAAAIAELRAMIQGGKAAPSAASARAARAVPGGDPRAPGVAPRPAARSAGKARRGLARSRGGGIRRSDRVVVEPERGAEGDRDRDPDRDRDRDRDPDPDPDRDRDPDRDPDRDRDPDLDPDLDLDLDRDPRPRPRPQPHPRPPRRPVPPAPAPPALHVPPPTRTSRIRTPRAR